MIYIIFNRINRPTTITLRAFQINTPHCSIGSTTVFTKEIRWATISWTITYIYLRYNPTAHSSNLTMLT